MGSSNKAMRFPHTRGDGPGASTDEVLAEMFSPHPWGWTELITLLNDPIYVFPTPVGMDRDFRDIRSALSRFPHTRGDGPATDEPFHPTPKFSPHPWGWTGSAI